MLRALALAALLWLGAGGAQAQISLLGLQNSLVQFALSRISTPGRLEITAEGVQEGEDGRTELAGVRVADGRGVWLEIDAVGLRWNPARILRGELEISRLFARGVRVLRRPEPAGVELAPSETPPPAPFSWPRAPLSTRVEAMELIAVSLAPGVVAAQGLAFDAKGSARDEGAEQAAALNLTRTDAVAGAIALDYLRDFAAGTLRLTLRADEAAGGVAGELAGFPPDSAVRMRVDADGPLDDWAVAFDASADRVFDADGRARVVVGPPLSVDATLSVTPGPAMAAEIAAALAPRAELVARVGEDADGVIAIREGAVRAPALTMDASGFFARPTGALSLDVALQARAALAALVPGVDFDAVGFDGAVSGSLAALVAEGALTLRGLRTQPADVGAADLAARVRVAGPVIDFDLDGSASGLRLDRLAPATVGAATLAARGRWDGAVAELGALRFASPLLDIEASGRIDVAGEAAGLSYAVAAPDLAPIARAYGADAAGGFSAAGRLDGALAAPRLEGRAELTGLRLGDEPLGGVTLRHDASFGAVPQGTAVISADGSRFGPARAAGAFRLEGTRLALDGLSADALGATVEGAVTVDTATGLAEGAVTARSADMAALSALSGGAVAGAADLAVTLAAPGGRQDATVTGAVRGFDGFGAQVADATLDVALTDAFGAGAGASGRLALQGVSAAGAEVGAMRLDGAARDLRGAPSARGVLEGQALRYGDATVAALRFEGEARDLLGAPQAEGVLSLTALDAMGAQVGALRLEAAGSDLTGAAAARGTLGAERLAFGDATIAALTLSGEGRDLLAAPQGALRLAAERLAAGGVATPRATLEAALSREGAVARATAALRAEPGDAGGLRFGALALDATADDALGAAPRLEAALTLGPSVAGPLALGATTLTARGPLSGVDFALSLAGAMERGGRTEPLALEARARLDAAAAPALARVDRFSARLGAAEVALTQPLRLTLGESVAAQGLALALPGGDLTGEATLHADGAAGALSLELTDVAPMARLAGAPLDAGALDARARFDLRPARAAATLSLEARGLRPAGVALDPGGLDLAAEARWNGRRVSAEAAVSGPFERPLRLSAAAPLTAPDGVPAFAPGAPVTGRLNWEGRIGDLWALVPAADHVLDGDVTLDLGFDGPLARPRLSGEVGLRDGRYENLEVGAILTDLVVTSRVEPDGAFALRATAQDGAGAAVTAEARLAGGVVTARAQTTGAVLARRDDVTAQITADVTLNGPLDALTLAGRATVDRAEVRLVNATPPSVASLGAVRIKGAPPAPAAQGGGGAVALDLTLGAPGTIFVRGRGLDSVWGMDLRVTGDAGAPSVRGAIEKVRGQLTLVGARFDLVRGAVRFSGGQPIDPVLDVALLREAGSITGGVVVRGFASNPQISFESQPQLPESEVLPRVLFDKSQQSLSAPEALQLAAGLATLLDGSGGVLDGIRASAGLDVLRVEGTGEDASVAVGSTVADGVFVGAKQPLDGGPARVTVEIEVFPSVTVDTEVGAGQSGSVGLNWRRDF